MIIVTHLVVDRRVRAATAKVKDKAYAWPTALLIQLPETRINCQASLWR